MSEHERTSSPGAQASDTEEVVARLEHLPLETITLILLVSGRRHGRLRRWVRRVLADPDLSRCPLVVVRKSIVEDGDTDDDLDDHDGDDESDLDDLGPDPLEGMDILQLTDNPDPGEAETRAGYERLLDGLTTPYLAIVDLPSRKPARHQDRLKNHIALELDRITQVGVTSERPLLLFTRQRSKLPSRTWLHREIGLLGEDPDPAFRDYLAFLALATSVARLEGVDLKAADRELELFGRVSLGPFNNVEPPPWSYRYAIATPSREVLTERTAHLEQRLDNKGGRRWENVVGRIAVDEIPEGNHRVMIGVDTPFAPLRTLQALAPRAGVLAPAREVLLGGDGSHDDTRYLMHTVRGEHAWITLQRGHGKEARRRWDTAMVRKDARAVVKGGDSRRMRLARLTRLATLPRYRKKDIWLVGERSDTAQDNGFHFFRYMRENHPERDVYYIIDKDSPQRDRVAHLGNVVDHSSARHRLLMMHATVLANAYSIKHMIPRQWTSKAYTRDLAWRVGAHRVYLKHGVHVSPTAVKRGTGGYDLYLSVNPMERDALRESSGYRDQIVETGMPRYDTLVPTPPTRTILFMPTWRRYLVPKLFGPGDEAQVPYEGSTYERFITGLLHSPQLHDILTRHDYRLRLLPHYNLRQEMADVELTSDRTELADTTKESFQDLIRGCDVFITDYSSVHFDVAYLGTPIIYTHFDKDEYEDGHAIPSWYDHDTDAFGPVVSSLQETLLELDSLLSRGATPDPRYQQRIDAAFTFHDHHNSQRVAEAVDEMLERARTGQ